MSELQRLRRAGGGALKLIVDLLPEEWDPRSGYEDVCVIFADIAGYSDFVAAEGDDAALAVLAVLEIQVQRALAGRRGARVVKRLGDGLMVVVRNNSDAVDAALALVDGFDSHAAQAQWPLRLRAGLHRGSTRRQGDDYFGYHVNLTARVAEAAPGGRVLATANVLAGVDLCGLCITARPAGELTAKGVSGPVDLFVVRRFTEAGCERLAG